MSRCRSSRLSGAGRRLVLVYAAEDRLRSIEILLNDTALMHGHGSLSRIAGWFSGKTETTRRGHAEPGGLTTDPPIRKTDKRMSENYKTLAEAMEAWLGGA